MKNKNDFIGHYVSIKYSDRPSWIFGILINYSDEWALIRLLVDYQIDGYIIISNKNIKEFRVDTEKERFDEKVLELRIQHKLETKKLFGNHKAEKIPLNDLKSILTYITERFGVFAIERKSEGYLYLGKLKSIDSRSLTINNLDPWGKWSGIRKFRPGDIRVIKFDTDYINSLKLLFPAKKKKS